jgi:hypothetical protein
MRLEKHAKEEQIQEDRKLENQPERNENKRMRLEKHAKEEQIQEDRKLPRLCSKCAGFGHIAVYCKTEVDDTPRITQLYKERLSERKKIKKERDRLRKVEERKCPEKQLQEKLYRLSKRSSEPRLTDLLQRVASYSSSARIAQPRASCVVSREELDRVDADLDFTAYKREDNSLFKEACPKFSYEFMTYNCCTVCGCDSPKGETIFRCRGFGRHIYEPVGYMYLFYRDSKVTHAACCSRTILFK